jgi:hypothetical protein
VNGGTLADRLPVLRAGAAALRTVEARLRAESTSASDTPANWWDIREVMSLAERLELDLTDAGLEAADEDLARGVDAQLSMSYDAVDRAVIAACEARLGESPYRGGELSPEDAAALRALGALAELLARYATGEFMPPPSWFGLPDGPV